MSKKHKKKNKKQKIRQRQVQSSQISGIDKINREGEKMDSRSNVFDSLAATLRTRADYATNQKISQEENLEQDEKTAYIKQDIRRIVIVGGLSLGIIFCFLIVMAKTDFFVPILEKIAEVL